jgi:hypothetical protein
MEPIDFVLISIDCELTLDVHTNRKKLKYMSRVYSAEFCRLGHKIYNLQNVTEDIESTY